MYEEGFVNLDQINHQLKSAVSPSFSYFALNPPQTFQSCLHQGSRVLNNNTEPRTRVK